MKLWQDEWRAFNSFKEAELSAIPLLTEDQKISVRKKAVELKAWQRSHPRIHNCITASVIVFNLSLIYLLAFYIPSHYRISLSGQIALSILYGHVAYGLTVYSLHELSGHGLGFVGNSKVMRILNSAGRNVCRLFHADPLFYLTQHPSHHSDTGTQDDLAFTNAISLKRFLISIIPFAVATPVCDYKIHTKDEWTKSKAVSEVLSTIVLILIIVHLYIQQGWVNAAVFLLLAPWASFFFDRLRETTEHNFMPDTRGNEARSFGPGLWGFIVGGGPWGQCCHLAHHLAPSLPWYQQILLHQHLSSLLTSEQKRIFLPGGLLEFPRLCLNILRKQNVYFTK